jgi:hypothetical protein
MCYLERKYPAEFSLRTVNRNLNSTETPIGDRIDESQLRRYSELMEQFRRENEAKLKPLPAPEQASSEST